MIVVWFFSVLLRLFKGCYGAPHVVTEVVFVVVSSWPEIDVQNFFAEFTCHEHVRTLMFVFGALFETSSPRVQDYERGGGF